jgi:hypothetical protein
MGFQEQSPDQVRESILVNGIKLKSLANDREFICGRLELLSLKELRRQSAENSFSSGRLTVTEVIGDVQQLHQHGLNSGALFQVASQFNLLEMVSPSRTPEHGVGIYECDRTQGPACAIACGAGTVYRNYLVPVNDQIGQSASQQLDCLADLGRELGNTDGRLWTMQNGYAMPSAAGLQEIHQRLSSMTEDQLDQLRQLLLVGIHWDTQVTLGKCSHTVSQAYCSALPVAYCSHSSPVWAPFARLVLDAAYEATFHAAMINAGRTGSRRVFLTLLGGGAFGNEMEWIVSAIERSLDVFANAGLDIAIVSYGRSNASVRQLISRWQKS